MATFRKTVFINNNYYHVFNRGVERRTIFLTKRDYERFLHTFIFYRLKLSDSIRYSKVQLLNKEKKDELSFKMKFIPTRVSIISYCCMPNHFHFLLRQDKENGISQFMSDLTNSYTKYFNTKQKRVGPLFQGSFKAVYVESEEQLLHLSRYIHINPYVSSIASTDQILDYPYSSLPMYLRKENISWLVTEPVLSQFSKSYTYEQFILDQISYGKELEKIKHLILED